MLDIWLDNQHRLTEINNLWLQSEQSRKEFEKIRDAAAVSLNQLLELVVTEAKKIYGECKIKTELILDKGMMVGLKVWINDNCHILKTQNN